METNAARAREIARAYLRPYLRLSNYVNSWRRAGFDDSDFADNVSNRLVDTLVAWGDEDAFVGRIREHWQAACFSYVSPRRLGAAAKGRACHEDGSGRGPPLPSSRTPQCFGVIFPAKVWVTIFPSFTTKVSVPIS